MKILVVGGGGREHAIIRKLSESPKATEILCVPGNAGIAKTARCISADAEDVVAVTEIARKERPDLVVIGPEVPLAKGLTDSIEAEGITVFGPDKKCSQLEASKSFTKSFLMRHDIPTADYREYTDINALKADIGIFGYPMVLKADGLAAGKGVVLAADAGEAERAIDEMMGEKVFGSAGDTVVVEECLKGIEASVLCFVDGSAIVPMESAQDYKRIGDRDEGANTGGMGTYSPSLVFTPELEVQIQNQILTPTFEGFKKDGLDFKGVLFIGLMITKDGPKVIEFNNRFGDPEAQSVLSRLETDLLDIFLSVTQDRLAEQEIKWSKDCAVCVVMASGGYPGAYEKGKPITGLDDVDDDVFVYHAGTKHGSSVAYSSSGGCDSSVEYNSSDEHGLPRRRNSDDEILTAGGRVLGVTATGATHEEARAKAYANVKIIDFDGAYYRTDIGVIYE